MPREAPVTIATLLVWSVMFFSSNWHQRQAHFDRKR
jgi:hypothetical protein